MIPPLLALSGSFYPASVQAEHARNLSLAASYPGCADWFPDQDGQAPLPGPQEGTEPNGLGLLLRPRALQVWAPPLAPCTSVGRSRTRPPAPLSCPQEAQNKMSRHQKTLCTSPIFRPLPTHWLASFPLPSFICLIKPGRATGRWIVSGATGDQRPHLRQAARP